MTATRALILIISLSFQCSDASRMEVDQMTSVVKQLSGYNEVLMEQVNTLKQELEESQRRVGELKVAVDHKDEDEDIEEGILRDQTNASGGNEQFIPPTEKTMQTVIRAFQAIIADETLAIGVVDRVDANKIMYVTKLVPGTSLKKYLGPKDVGTLGPLQLRVLPAGGDYLDDPDFKKRNRNASGTYGFGINGSNGSPRRWLEITRGTDDGLPLTYLPWSTGTCTYTHMEPNTRAFITGPFTGCVAYVAVKNDQALVVHCNRRSGESYHTQFNTKVGQIAQNERLRSQGWRDLKLIHQHGVKNKSGQVVPGWGAALGGALGNAHKFTGSHWLWGVKVDPDGPWTFGYIQNFKRGRVNGGHRNNNPHDPNMRIVGL